MVKFDLKVRNDFDTGKVASVVQISNRYESKIKVEKGNKAGNLKSIMGMISLALQEGDLISLVIDGPDEKEAELELKKII